MEEYQNSVNINDLESDMVDEFFNEGNDGSISKLNIINLFGKERLENIQKSLSKATGLAFVTVNFKGDPITEPTSFSRFCQRMRNTAANEKCKSSDAFGSIQAAVIQKINVYFCPCGLLEVAIPIIVKGHYLGGFIGGQIRCLDAPESVSHLASVMCPNEVDKLQEELFEEISIFSYEKFMDIANLVSLVINQLSENEINQHMQGNLLKERINKLQEINRNLLKENAQKSRLLQELKVRSNPYELLDVLTALMNLSIIEDAPQTNELLSAYIEYTKYKYLEQGTFVHVSEELEHAEQYLIFQQKKKGKYLEYHIQVPKEMHMQKIPSGVLMPFLQNAFYNGIMLKEGEGKIHINGHILGGNFVLEIQDNGPAFNENELDLKYEMYQDKHEGYYIKLGMNYAKEKMKQLFGEEGKIIVESYKNQGCKSTLIWPEYSSGRVE